MEKLIIGANVTFGKDKQLYGSLLETLDYGANTFLFYTGAPQNTVRSELNKDRTEEAYELMKANNIRLDDIVIHAPYIINLANPKNHDFSCDFLIQEIKRSEQLGIKKIVLHPGSHVGVGISEGLKNISDSLNEVLEYDSNVIICLETMAGKGTELGTNFEQLKQIIDNVKKSERIMVCLDTCHLNDAGYDMSNIDSVLDEFDRIIGISKIGCVHINDSKNEQGSHKDRHENIGLGTIGFDNMINIIYNKRLQDVPKFLETPFVLNEEGSKLKFPPYKFEIEMIKNKKYNDNLLDDIRKYYR